MKAFAGIGIVTLALIPLGCSTSPRSQERVRENTANATAAIASSAKSAVLGIRDGLARKPAETGVNINTATRADLESLPGVTPAMARNIIANRPYKNPNELRKEKIVPKDVYNKISSRLTVIH
jgi:competence protein ComEA